jgi:hypothetical protein
LERETSNFALHYGATFEIHIIVSLLRSMPMDDKYSIESTGQYARNLQKRRDANKRAHVSIGYYKSRATEQANHLAICSQSSHCHYTNAGSLRVLHAGNFRSAFDVMTFATHHKSL